MLLNMVTPVEKEVVDSSRFQGQVAKPLPASRYLDTTNITFKSLREFAMNSSDRVYAKLLTLREEFGELFESSSPVAHWEKSSWRRSSAPQYRTDLPLSS